MRRATAFFASVVMLLSAVPAKATTYIGNACFQLDNYSDTWIFRVEFVGDVAVQLTGNDPSYLEPTSITGGGIVNTADDTFVASFVEARTNGRRAIHSIIIDLTTGTGTDDFSWSDPDGSNQSPYTDEPFSAVACPTGPLASSKVASDSR